MFIIQYILHVTSRTGLAISISYHWLVVSHTYGLSTNLGSTFKALQYPTFIKTCVPPSHLKSVLMHIWTIDSQYDMALCRITISVHSMPWIILSKFDFSGKIVGLRAHDLVTCSVRRSLCNVFRTVCVKSRHVFVDGILGHKYQVNLNPVIHCVKVCIAAYYFFKMEIA